ncbi:MAG: sugar phosphate nucleotidyltransferase [Lamprobacter sp.]|uniref:sugar phosphate nucleotidyltransferase n=1 Tax=Lamprobacter sp. TaxID=3100796 RepID=UPI002B2568C9|nr:sugar phosphate nucleotidyltransferase [Lamprobacter sp.]MEA3641639.1 sugar phosphate nucleotidyltransferase [Lamprobacter sp.]
MQPNQSHAGDRNSIMAMVMAGGQGSRLRPLTDKRSKPAVPFGARYRIVDFVLSNLVNSGISTIYLLVQYNVLLGAATLVKGARVRNSIVRREAVIEEGAEVEDSIIMDYVRVSKGARLRRVIVDRHNLIEREMRIGWDIEKDRSSLPVTDSGIVVVPRGRTPFFARGPRGAGGGYSD